MLRDYRVTLPSFPFSPRENRVIHTIGYGRAAPSRELPFERQRYGSVAIFHPDCFRETTLANTFVFVCATVHQKLKGNQNNWRFLCGLCTRRAVSINPNECRDFCARYFDAAIKRLAFRYTTQKKARKYDTRNEMCKKRADVGIKRASFK